LRGLILYTTPHESHQLTGLFARCLQ